MNNERFVSYTEVNPFTNSNKKSTNQNEISHQMQLPLRPVKHNYHKEWSQHAINTLLTTDLILIALGEF